jgi:hypothetical protein
MRQDDRTFARLLADSETSGTVLLIGLLDEFGTEFFDWEPDTLLREIKARWRVDVPVANRDKIWALVTVLTTNLFTTDLDAFVHVCNSLSDQGADFENWNPADTQEMAWALAEISLLDGEEALKGLAPEIIAYMGAQLDAEGFTEAPQLLKAYVPVEVPREQIGLALEADSIDTNAWWDAQTRKRLSVDEYVKTRLLKLVQEVSSLPLTHANSQALADLRSRAETTLAGQAKETAQAAGSVSPTPSL